MKSERTMILGLGVSGNAISLFGSGTVLKSSRRSACTSRDCLSVSNNVFPFCRAWVSVGGGGGGLCGVIIHHLLSTICWLTRERERERGGTPVACACGGLQVWQLEL